MDIKTAAARGFSLLAKQYQIDNIFYNNFWFGGNSLHTCLDYMIAAGVNDAEQKPHPLLKFAFEQIYSPVSNGGWWRDDYGWWGDSFVLAINNRQALGYGASAYDRLFTDIATATDFCWQRMHDSWSDAPYGIVDDHAKGKADITGGVFNLPNDSSEQLAGRNSVTNEGYWLLSMGLKQLYPGNPKYAQAVTAIQTWMREWLVRTPTCNGGQSAIGILDLQCHVLERPMQNLYVPAWYWTGDQGLFSRALLTSGVSPARSDDIFNAMMKDLKDDANVLHENMVFQNQLGGFTGDYATGKGIFMRSVAQFDIVPTSKLAQMIMASASAVWCNRNGTTDRNRDKDQFTFNWNRNLQPQYESLWLASKGNLDNLIMQAAGQDALNTALRLSPTAVFPCD